MRIYYRRPFIDDYMYNPYYSVRRRIRLQLEERRQFYRSFGGAVAELLG